MRRSPQVRESVGNWPWADERSSAKSLAQSLSRNGQDVVELQVAKMDCLLNARSTAAGAQVRINAQVLGARVVKGLAKSFVLMHVKYSPKMS